jgi:hypothetical protein
MITKEQLQTAANTIREYLDPGGIEECCRWTGVSEADFVEIEPSSFKGRIFAIDGSNSLICDWSAVKANHIRAGYVVYSGREWQKTVTTCDEIFLSDQRCYIPFFERPLREIFGIDGFELKKSELDRLSTYYRELQEYIAVVRALSLARSGDLVLYDGGFALWKDLPFQGAIDFMFSMAEEKEADILAVSKSSTFSWGAGRSRPLVQHMGIVGDKAVPSKPWYIDLEGKLMDPNPSEGAWHGMKEKGKIYIVRFCPGASHAFRVDAPMCVGRRIDEALSHCAMFSTSAESPGYPHALYRAHQEMTIKEDESWLLKMRLMGSLRSAIGSSQGLQGALDYHESMNVMKR